MGIIATEGPILLGYAVVAVAVFALAAIVVILDPETKARRARNAAARAHRRELEARGITLVRNDAGYLVDEEAGR